MNNQSGYSLTELLVILAIIALLTVTAYPSINGMLERQATTTAINRMIAAINLSRHTAMQYGATVTLCALKKNGKCGSAWSGELTVFLDRNGNAKKETSEQTVRVVPPLTSGASIKWRVFGNRQYLQMTTLGLTNYQNGNFVACPASGNQRWARQIVINIQGRVRRNHRINKTGYPVDRRGKLLRC